MSTVPQRSIGVKKRSTEAHKALGVYTQSMLETAVAAAGAETAVVDGMIRSRSVNLFAGASGIGKSPLCKQLGIAVAAGVPFLGRPTTQGTVLYLDGENAPAECAAQARAIALHLGLSSFPDDTFFTWSPNWGDGESIRYAQRIGKLITHYAPTLVIIDPLRVFYPGAELKSSDGVQMIQALRQMATNDCAFVILHHLRKADRKVEAPDLTEDPRRWLQEVSGSHALINQTDLRLGVVEDDHGIVLAGLLRGVGQVGPFHLARQYDDDGDCAGYTLQTGADLLSLNDRNTYRRLPDTFTFLELKTALGGKSGSNATRWLRRSMEVHVVEEMPTGGYRKIRGSGESDGLSGLNGLRNKTARFPRG